jgi:hypothetical protein
MAKRIKELMSERRVEVLFVDIPGQYKDVGEMTYDAAVELIFKHLH